jgi:hypothetical protein
MMLRAENRRLAARIRARWVRRVKAWALKEHRRFDDSDLPTVRKFVESHGCCQCVSHRLKYDRPAPGTAIWD